MTEKSEGLFQSLVLIFRLNFPHAVAFSVFADEQTFFLKGLGQTFCCSFRLPDMLRQHFLCCLWILPEEVQCDLFQSAIVALWNGTLGGLPFFPKNVAEPVFEFILPLEEQVLKEAFQIYRG